MNIRPIFLTHRRNQPPQTTPTNPLSLIHQEREKERQKERDRERYVIMRQSQRHQAQKQNQEENIYENCGQKRNIIHGIHIPPF